MSAPQCPAANELSLNIAKEHFGEPCEVVCKSLVERGVQSLQELVLATGMPAAVVRRSLLVLMQHSCVASCLETEESRRGAGTRSRFVYELSLPALHQQLRKPEMLLYIRDTFETDATQGQIVTEDEAAVKDEALAEACIQALFQHGSLRYDQVLSTAADICGVNGLEAVVLQLRAVFRALVSERFIELVPPCTLPRLKQQIHPAAVKSRGRNNTELTDAQLAQQSAEMAHNEHRMVRFSDTALQAAERHAIKQEAAAEANLSNKRTLEGSDPTEPDSKRPKLESATKEEAPEAAAFQETAAEQLHLWRANMEELNRRLRHEVCIQMVRDKHGSTAATALAAMLAASRQHETKVREARTVPLAVGEVWRAAQIMAHSRSSADHHTFKGEREVNEALNDLAGDASELISFFSNGPMGDVYIANTERIIEVQRTRELETAIKGRFGQPGLRIFRLLGDKKQMEQKQVAEKAMLPTKDTRELLYSMLKAGYVSLQDIPRTADHAPARTMYTFHVDGHSACDNMAAGLYRAALNVRLRLQHELKLETPILELVAPTVDVVKRKAAFEMYGARIKRFSMIQSLLQTQSLRLDRLIAIFNEF